MSGLAPPEGAFPPGGLTCLWSDVRGGLAGRVGCGVRRAHEAADGLGVRVGVLPWPANVGTVVLHHSRVTLRRSGDEAFDLCGDGIVGVVSAEPLDCLAECGLVGAAFSHLCDVVSCVDDLEVAWVDAGACPAGVVDVLAGSDWFALFGFCDDAVEGALVPGEASLAFEDWVAELADRGPYPAGAVGGCAVADEA